MPRAPLYPETMQFGLDSQRSRAAWLGGSEKAAAAQHAGMVRFWRQEVEDWRRALGRCRTDEERARCEQNLRHAEAALFNLTSRAIAAE